MIKAVQWFKSFLAPWRDHGTAGCPVNLLVLRLENTEMLAETLGKAGMGHLLVCICMRLSATVRPDDPVQIIAPGVFTVTLNDRCEVEAMRIAERLQQQAQKPVAVTGLNVTPVLTGVLVHATETDNPAVSTLMEDALARLEQTDAEMLGHVRLYDHETVLPLPATVADAVHSDQMVAYFQPQLCCHTGNIMGFEMLARWQHPVRGLLTPAAFMPKMTERDHNSLTLSMLRQGLAALKRWDADGWNVPGIALNVSHCELVNPGFAASLLWELDRQDIPPRRLVLEVLETVGPVTSNGDVRANLSMLAKAGCRLDLDDFGTGYASLDAIRQFGVHRIKIDRSFVMGCDVDPAQQRMILAILALADRLNIATLAEGVETTGEHAFLAQMGCDQVQGYAIARPMPLAEATAFLVQHAQTDVSIPDMPRRSAG